jgi:hypothetical protein
VRTASVVLMVAAAVLVSLPAGAAFELRTWTTPAAAPATGAPLCASASFVMRARLGGPFAGRAESTSFALWGCSAYTPVDVAFFGVLTEPLCVTLRWSSESLGGIQGFNVRRASDPAGPFARINDEMLPPAVPASYEDRAVWPGSQFWYELWVVQGDGTEARLTVEPVSVTTGGTLETKLYTPSPNPFRESTVIQLDVASLDGGVSLDVYDVAGRLVRSLRPVCERSGRYFVAWDGTNDNGGQVASGVYFCRLEAGGKSQTNRVVVLK